MTYDGRVAFRTGGGRGIGFGHIRRCLSLGLALRDLGVQSLFLLDGDIEVSGIVTVEGFDALQIRIGHDLKDTIRLCKDYGTEAIVADSYTFSKSYFQSLGKAARVIVVLDDLADRELPVNIVVNGSAVAERLHYFGSQHTKYLLGPEYILLRPEFAQLPPRAIENQVRSVLTTVGGSDPSNLTVRLMRWVNRTLGSIRQDVVVGPLFDNLESLRGEIETLGGSIILHKNPENMRNLMLSADLALCGGGQTAYELAATGTPAIAIRTAKNQTVNLEGLSICGSLIWVGDVSDADLEVKVTDVLKEMAGNASQRTTMSRAGQSLVDGQGASRVARAIQEFMGFAHL